MSRLTRSLALGATALALPVALVASSSALPGELAGRPPGGGTTSPVLERAALGPVDQYGGARRLAGDQTRRIAAAVRGPGAKNVILVIGDGMGDSEITIARNYLVGAGGFLRGIDALPMTGQMTHYSVDRATGLPDYAADSSATATAWATGVKTYDGAVGVDRHGRPRQTILEWARRWGRATGNVTTSDVQDATPAAVYAHISSRGCKGPDTTSRGCAAEALENGGPGSISEQLLLARPDLTLGGGSAFFDEAARAGRWQGRTLAEQAVARGFQYLTDTAALDGVRRADQAAPVLGLFTPAAMPVRFSPLLATRGGAELPAARCTTNPASEQVPSLAGMTEKAIELLSTSAHGRRNGFFLQVESASIDKSDHAADVCGQVGETEQLDEAVQEALEFARRDPSTLVVVTADHAHTSQIVGSGTPGHDVRLRTADGADMVVTYGTGPLPGAMQHTGTQLRVAGYGPGAANVVGLIDQTDLFFVMRDSMSAWAGPRGPLPYGSRDARPGRSPGRVGR